MCVCECVALAQSGPNENQQGFKSNPNIDERGWRRSQLKHCLAPSTPCTCPFSAGARRCPLRCSPCTGSFGTGTRRRSIHRIHGTDTLSAGVLRCPVLCMPGTCTFGTGARRCSIPCSHGIETFKCRACARRCSIPCSHPGPPHHSHWKE